MKKANLFFFFSFLFQFMNAQELRIPLWPEAKVPNYQKTSETEKKVYTEILSISLVQTPDINVYLPTKKNANGQAVLICPGGGYGILAYDWEGTDIAKWLNAQGIAAFVLKYRLPNSKSNVVPYLSPITDAKRALRIIRFNAGKWNIRSNQIGVMGFSAGGHLASTLGTQFDEGNSQSSDSIEQQSARPDFMILVYPVISMTKTIMHAGSRNNLIGEHPDSSLARRFSNELQVTANTPPTFLVHATDDNAVPVENSLLFYEALKSHGVSTEMHIFPKGGHGFALGLSSGTAVQWTNLCVEWIRSWNR
ncbi:MAG: alpha/beta hydrolase [Flavisolibacter sp.]